MDNKEIVISQSGPLGRKLPVIASSFVANLNEFLFPDGAEEPCLDKYEEALTRFKECGFDGFIAKINEGPIISPGQPIMSEELVELVLRKAASHNLFIILCSNRLYYEPLKEWIKEVKKDADNLPLAAKINLYRERYKAYLGEFVNRYKNLPGFGGIALNDEPYYNAMRIKFDPATATKTDLESRDGTLYCLSNRYSIVRELLFEDDDSQRKGNTVLLMNLVGDQKAGHLKIHENEEPDYIRYLNTFKDIITGASESGPFPYLWSYDFYPLRQFNVLLNDYLSQFVVNSTHIPLNRNGEMSIEYQNFYEVLELFHEYSEACGGIFWNYVQSMQFYVSTKERPYALEQYLRFQVFSSLAMGVRGIVYWTYFQRDHNQNELYLSAPIDRADRKTAAWYYAQRINAEINRYNDIFRYAVLEDWGHVGEIYPGCRMLPEEIKYYIQINTKPEDKGVLVTMLRSLATYYIVVVSHDPESYQEIYFRIGITSKMTILTPQKIEPETPGIGNARMKTTLEPGGYMIFKIQR